MRTITTTKTVYTYDELSEDVKAKALENLYDINVDMEWWDAVFEDAETIGLKIKDFDIDRGGYVKGEFIDGAEVAARKIIETHGPDCETYKTAAGFRAEREEKVAGAEIDEYGNYNFDFEIELGEDDDEFLKSLCEDYRIMLTQEYEYLTSEEAIVGTIEANEYEFSESGKLA